jgi:hypothetical protein
VISRIKLPVAIGLGSVCFLGVMFFINPTVGGVFPDCPSRVFFGVDCPGCGGLRGTYSLLHGDLPSVINHNALLLGVYPMLIAVWFSWVLRVWKQRELFAIFRPYSRVIAGAGFFILIGFTVVRNMIPGLEWGSGA